MMNTGQLVHAVIETDKGEAEIVGYLSILAFDFEHVKAGMYIANEAGVPFAYPIKRILNDIHINSVWKRAGEV